MKSALHALLLLLAATGCALGRAPTAPTGELTASVLTAMPSETPAVNGYRAGEAAGLRWYWTAEGRRDMGQGFRVEKAFSANRLAVQINSGSGKAAVEPAFKLIWARAKAGSDEMGETVAVREGKLPRETLRAGTWLSMTFDPVALEPGSYYFLLQFNEERPDQSVVLNVGKPDAYPDGKGIQSLSKDPTHYAAGATLNFLIFKETDSAQQTSSAPASTPTTSVQKAGRVLEVNQHGGTPYKTIAAAAKDVQPGDTIRLAAGSGPYREIVHIAKSGEVGAPIIFDGNGETVTGLEPLVFKKEGDFWTCDLTAFFAALKYVQGFEKKNDMWVNTAQPLAFPSVLVFRGKRVFQEAGTGRFGSYATLSDEGRKLTLAPGVEPTGWEIASRDAVFRILNVSHHLYRHTRASGSLNDGYNLHGVGTDLVFENIEGFQNIDEGFSAHDKIECIVNKGRFWENENGLVNVESSSMKATDIETFSNSGWGFGLRRAQGELDHIRSWDNGVAQVVFLPGTTVTCRNVTAVKPAGEALRWMTAEEARRATTVSTYEKAAEAVVTGDVVIEPPGLATATSTK